jgi:hydroxylaminobenzene mutase
MSSSSRSRSLLASGATLFLLGLIAGLLVMVVRNPRMGLSAHLEGVGNGTFLMVVGLLWSHLRLSPRQQTATFWLLLYGTFANWAFVLLGAAFGISRAAPIAGAGFSAAPWQETLVEAGLVTVGLTMLVGCGLLVVGLVRRAPDSEVA